MATFSNHPSSDFMDSNGYDNLCENNSCTLQPEEPVHDKEAQPRRFRKVSSSSHLAFPLCIDMIYSANNKLSIEVDNAEYTFTIDKWISLHPLIFAQLRNQKFFELEPHLNRILFERMRRIPNKEKMFLGLKLNIKFPGYSDLIPASIPYKRFPVKFYNWWINNPDEIRLSFKEKLDLLNNVNMLDKKILKPKHKALMNR